MKTSKLLSIAFAAVACVATVTSVTNAQGFQLVVNGQGGNGYYSNANPGYFGYGYGNGYYGNNVYSNYGFRGNYMVTQPYVYQSYRTPYANQYGQSAWGQSPYGVYRYPSMGNQRYLRGYAARNYYR